MNYRTTDLKRYDLRRDMKVERANVTDGLQEGFP